MTLHTTAEAWCIIWLLVKLSLWHAQRRRGAFCVHSQPNALSQHSAGHAAFPEAAKELTENDRVSHHQLISKSLTILASYEYITSVSNILINRMNKLKLFLQISHLQSLLFSLSLCYYRDVCIAST